MNKAQGQGKGKACGWTTSRLPNMVVSSSVRRSLVPPDHISPHAKERDAKLEPHSAMYSTCRTYTSCSHAVFDCQHQTVIVFSLVVLLSVLLL